MASWKSSIDSEIDGDDEFRDDRESENSGSIGGKDRSVDLQKKLETSRRRGFVDLDVACIKQQQDNVEVGSQDVRLPPFRIYFEKFRDINTNTKSQKSTTSTSINRFPAKLGEMWSRAKSKVRKIIEKEKS